jgi:AraC family transcriptional regulator
MSASLALAEPLCYPRTASNFRLERQVLANGFQVDIRRFSWDHDWDSEFEANAYYLDYSLGPRAQETYFVHPEPPGETVFLPKGSSFRAHCAPSTHRLLCLTFDNSRVDGLFEADALSGYLRPCLDLRVPRIHHALASLAAEVQNPGFAQDIRVESIALALVVDLCRHFRAQQSLTSPQGGMADWRLSRLKEHIRHGLDAPLSLAGLASACGLSPRHLNRTFKAAMGMTLGNYIAGMRVAEAKRLLAQPDTPIKVIAQKCGFQTASAFSACFHKNTGQTPKQFRDECYRF